jgi:hypothetical protein
MTRVVKLALSVALAVATAGCGSVEAWRSVMGVDKNDPDPQTAPFTGNLAEGEATPYPNLASVPPPPTRATTTQERQKLTQSLIADRNSAASQAGPPPPAGAATAKSKPNAAGPTGGAGTAVPAPAAAGAASAPARTASNAFPLGSTQSGRRKAGEPPEPVPPESDLQMPQVRMVPEPEAARPAPPAPALPAAPLPAAVAPPLPASVATMMPEPAPPPPVLAPVAPLPSAARPEPNIKVEPNRKPGPTRALSATTVATLDSPVAGAAAAPTGRDRAQIEGVAGLYRANPGTVRVIGYAAAPAADGGGDPLGSYHAALERAQAVARALVEAGIPANKIQTEAAPTTGARAPGRVEIQLAQ